MSAASKTEVVRERLLQLRRELEASAAENKRSGEIVELDQSKVGRLSRMDALQAQAMSQASGRRIEMKLSRIHAALGRVDAGKYGDCQSCDEPIAEKRLQFDPTTQLCIHCAQKAEQ